jgi:hypothetical protein
MKLNSLIKFYIFIKLIDELKKEVEINNYEIKELETEEKN